MMYTLLEQACERGEIRPLDLYIGSFLKSLANNDESIPELLLAGTLVSNAVGNGHVCLPLEQTAELPLQIKPSLIPDPQSWRMAQTG